MDSTTAAASLRSLGNAIGFGHGRLEPFVGQFLAVQHGTVVGCCALGSAYLQIEPGLRDKTNLPDELNDVAASQSDDINDKLLLTFPVLDMKSFSAGFLHHLGRPGEGDQADPADRLTLAGAIASMFDETKASFTEIDDALHKVAEDVEQLAADLVD